MALRITLLAFLAAMLVQNLAEAMAGGPAVPAPLQILMPARQNPLAALVLISAVLAALILPTIVAPSGRTRFAAAMAAGGLALNAGAQLVASAVAGTLLPGTLVGAVLMLPTSVASLWLLGRAAVMPAVIGMAVSPMVLLACWHLAASLP